MHKYVIARKREGERNISASELSFLICGCVFSVMMKATNITQTQPCILQLMEVMLADGTNFKEWQCELHDLDAWSTGRKIVRVRGLQREDRAQIRSGDTTLYGEGAYFFDGALRLSDGGRKKFARTTRKGPASSAEFAAMEEAIADPSTAGRRSLSATIEERSVLVARVHASDRRLSNSTSAIATAVFGTSKVNSLKERYETCSYGEVRMVPATGEGISNGIITITVGVSAAGSENSVVRDAALTVLTGRFGDLATRFDHVILCLPPGTLSVGNIWLGYGTRGKLLMIVRFEKEIILTCAFSRLRIDQPILALMYPSTMTIGASPRPF